MSDNNTIEWVEELTTAELDALRIAAETLLRLRWGQMCRIHVVEIALRSALVKLDRLLWLVDQEKARIEKSNAKTS